MTELLHYTMCGLEDVYLLDGYEYRETSRGRTLHVYEQDELHLAIGSYLIDLSRGLTGRELRFLREQLDLSQINLARLLGESDQSVARREKRSEPFKRPPTQDRILRYLFRQKLGDDEQLMDFLRKLSDADNAPIESVTFRKPQGDQWQQAERMCA